MPNMNGGLAMLTQSLESLPKSEKKVADNILANPQAVVSQTVHELAQESGTSSAAVIRLCKSLNLKGFQELKIRIVGDLQTDKMQGFRDIAPNEHSSVIIEKMTENSIHAIRETSQVLRLEELNNAVDAIIKADTIHFFGIGASAIIAADAQQKFIRINKNCTAFTDTHLVATLLANAKQNDVFFGISYSGMTSEVVKMIELAKKKGIRTVSLTKYGQTKVSESAEISLYAAMVKEAAFRSGATASRIAQLQVLDILFMSVATSQYDKVVKYLDETREAISFIKDGSKKRSRYN